MEYILDSGAYSAYKIGVNIDIDKYCEFIKQHLDIANHYIVLDVIGSDIKSYENLKYMQSKGLNPLPVFHQGDDFKYLEEFTNGSYDFICISPLNYSAHGGNMVDWLDRCFGDYICNRDGTAKLKVHGLGLTTPTMMARYPWYSVDSTSWKLSAGFGSIFIPVKKHNKYNFMQQKTVQISTVGNDWSQLSIHEQKYVLDYLEFMNVPFGDKNTNGVSNDYQYRRYINLLYTRELEKQINSMNTRFIKKKTKKRGLFV